MQWQHGISQCIIMDDCLDHFTLFSYPIPLTDGWIINAATPQLNILLQNGNAIFRYTLQLQPKKNQNYIIVANIKKPIYF